MLGVLLCDYASRDHIMTLCFSCFYLLQVISSLLIQKKKKEGISVLLLLTLYANLNVYWTRHWIKIVTLLISNFLLFCQMSFVFWYVWWLFGYWSLSILESREGNRDRVCKNFEFCMFVSFQRWNSARWI